MSNRKRKGLAAAGGLIALVALAALVGLAGCGGAEAPTTTAFGSTGRYSLGVSTTAGATTTAAAMTTTTMAGAYAPSGSGVTEQAGSAGDSSSEVALGGTLTALETGYGQKMISDAQIEIEVESGKFQTVFAQAMGLAGRYGGYLLNSSASASADGDTLKSGTVSIRVPSSSFSQALTDASNLGTLKSQTLSTQDVTEEYVDLQARIKNAQARVDSLVALFANAKTIDEIIKMQQYVLPAQQDLEELQGRMRYLTEHTSFSTLTISIREKGIVVKPEPVVEKTSWGVGHAFKDAGHYLVRVFNGIVRGLGVIIPVLVLLAIVGYIVYRIFRTAARRNRAQQQAAHQTYNPGWGTRGGPAPVTGMAATAPSTGPNMAPGAAPAGPANGQAVGPADPPQE